jgi:cytochrome c556
MKNQYPIIALVLAATLSAPALAQFKNDEHAVKYRQGAFATMAVHFGRLGAMANGKMAFDAATAKRDAEVVAVLSTLPWMGFTEGSEGISDKAKPEIWMETDKFKAKAQTLQERATALAAAAQTGDLDRIKAAFGATAKSCKACHDAYKN